MPASQVEFMISIIITITSAAKKAREEHFVHVQVRRAATVPFSLPQPLHLLLLLLLHPPGPLPALGAEQQLLRVLVLLKAWRKCGTSV